MPIRSLALVLPLLAGIDSGPQLIVHDEVLFPLDRRVFGQFLERPSWHGEIGVEAAVGEGPFRLDPKAFKLIRGLHAPVYRFPHGTDGDYVDWTDMIDNVPGRATERPLTKGHTGETVSNRFGYDEFLRMCESIGSEPMLVVNFRDGLLEKRPLAEAARHAAALVAYANAPVGKALPDGLERWAALRAKNGRRAPYRAPYFQVGNETWFFEGDLKRQFGERADERYLEALEAYVDAMRAVDPSIRILVDGHSPERNLMIRRRLGDKVHYLVEHYYTAWEQREVRLRDRVVPLERLTERDVWYGWTAVPDFDDRGQSRLRFRSVEQAEAHGYPVAVTEWNWNGWWAAPNPPLDSDLARGLGSAGILHALMRNGEHVRIANQSMTVGRNWNLAAIKVDPKGETPPHLRPSGLIFSLYARHHGPRVYRTEARNLTYFRQPYRFNAIRPADRVAHLDLVVTGGPRGIYVHALNRHFDQEQTLSIDLSALGRLRERATHHQVVGHLHNRTPSDRPERAWLESRPLRLEGNTLQVRLAPRSASVIELRR
jgi:alpha-L-arabinofuranosidase